MSKFESWSNKSANSNSSSGDSSKSLSIKKTRSPLQYAKPTIIALWWPKFRLRSIIDNLESFFAITLAFSNELSVAPSLTNITSNESVNLLQH